MNSCRILCMLGRTRSTTSWALLTVARESMTKERGASTERAMQVTAAAGNRVLIWVHRVEHERDITLQRWHTYVR